MSTVEVTDKNKIALLQQLSQTRDGTPHYADFVGGVAGCNGTNGQISWQAESDKGTALGAVLYGGSFVGGVAGYNDATATITNSQATILSVTGTIVATGDCVGGVIGLNGAASLPTVQVSANRIEGVHFVGGVIGANLPANEFKFVNAGGAAANAGHHRHRTHRGRRRGGRYYRLQPRSQRRYAEKCPAEQERHHRGRPADLAAQVQQRQRPR